MKVVVAYPGIMPHAEQTAQALLEVGGLDAFVTTFCWMEGRGFDRVLSMLPKIINARLRRELARRSLKLLPAEVVRQDPFWEIVRTVSSKVFRNPLPADWAWDHLCHGFDGHVARRYVPSAGAVMCFEYAAMASLTSAREHGVAGILQLPALDVGAFQDVLRRERENHPNLASEFDDYFDAKFSRRRERRLKEIELADIIVTNSRLTARSHIKAGADPQKVISVPLGCPDVPLGASIQESRRDAPLRVLWAGNFSIGKGAHYLLKAWEALRPGSSAELHVYGRNLLDGTIPVSTSGIVFHGSVAQPRLFEAYRAADVLVFPTLSDGFGMVVSEALAHGLPVITTDQAGAADLVGPHNGIVTPAANAAALRDAIQWCLDNREGLAAMKYGALETARRHQWSDFRRDLVVKLAAALKSRGYSPSWDFGAQTYDPV